MMKVIPGVTVGLVEHFEAQGLKVRPIIRSIDKTMSEMTRDELEKIYHAVTLQLLADPELTPGERQEILSSMDVCPCCQRWLGHNRPPPDEDDPPYRRQVSFDFEQKP